MAYSFINQNSMRSKHKNMKFLILSQNAGSAKHGMVIRNYNWARALADKGHKITIVASAYSHSRHNNPQTVGLVSKEVIEGIQYVWLWGPKYNAKSNFMRIISMGIYCMQLYFPYSFFKFKYDAIIVSCPPPFTVYPAVRLSRKLKSKLVYDIRDLWPLTPKLLGGYSDSHPLIRAMQHAECYGLRYADVTTAVPHNSKRYLVDKGMASNKFMPIRNGVYRAQQNYDKGAAPLEHLKAIETLREKHSFIIAYTGAIGRANAMDFFVKAIAKTPESISAIILGDGPFEGQIREIIKSLNLENRIILLPPINANQVNDFLGVVDATYCGMQKSPLYKYGASPTKLNDYMLAEKPIIYAVNEPNNAVFLSESGISCNAEDENSIADAINAMKQKSEEELNSMGQRGQQWAMQNVLVNKQMDQLLQKLWK